MSEPAAKERARRGSGFPGLALPELVRIVHTAGQHGTDFSLSAFAGYCGHSTANSGPFRAKLAAFRYFKLVSASGDRVLFTPLGRSFARLDDPLEDESLLRESFLECRIFAQGYEDSTKGVPVKVSNIRRMAIQDLNVASTSASAFVDSFVDSAIAAGLARVDKPQETVIFASTPTPGSVDDELIGDEASDRDQRSGGNEQPDLFGGLFGPRPQPQAPPSRPVLLQRWPTTSGMVTLTLHSADPLPSDAFGLIGDVVAAIDKLAKKLGTPVIQSDEPSDEPA